MARTAPAHKNPTAAFAGAALLESLFVPFLIDAMLLGLVMRGAKVWLLVAAAIPASILGTLAWYALGIAMGPEAITWIANLFSIAPATQETASQAWSENWALALFTASMTAIPDPLAAALAGMHAAPTLQVVAIISVSHALRFAIMGAIVAVASFGLHKTPRTVQVWASRLTLGASLLTGIILGGIILTRMWA